MIIYKIDLANDTSLDRIISYAEKDVNESSGITYFAYYRPCLNIYCAVDTPPKAKSIYLTFYGGSLKAVVKNEESFIYSLNATKISMSYGKKGKRDFYIFTDRQGFNREKVPTCLMLKKREASVFFILMTRLNPIEQMSPEELAEIASTK